MSALQKLHITPERYLEQERKAQCKSEYYQGEIFAMAGTTRKHSVVNARVIMILGNALRGKPCTVNTNDLRIHIPENSLFTYPDVSVVCGKPEMLDNEFDTLLNPLLIVEVLSDSTENYDRNGKFRLYRSIASLREYVLVSQDEPRIETFFKNEQSQWLYTEAVGLDASITLHSLNAEISLAEVYATIEFDADRTGVR